MRLALALSALLPVTARATPLDPVPLVDPLLGTSAGGDVTPGPLVPFGMIQWSPDTPGHPTSNYEYAATELQGFSLTHLSGTGCPNAAEFPIMATVGPGEANNVVGFTHDGEAASPGYYRVRLANGATVELTATTRAGLGQFTFPPTAAANILVDAGRASAANVFGALRADSPTELSGWTENGNFCGSWARYRVYLAARTDRPFAYTQLADGKVLLTFDARSAAAVRLKVAISYVSAENARANLAAEIPGWDLAAVRAAAEAAWRDRLGAIAAEGGTPEQTRIFYTGLYHALLHPNVFNDANGDYAGFDHAVRRLPPGATHYANFSGWDVYRSQLQLLTWLFPAVGSEVAASLVRDAAECGALPKWSQNNVEAGIMVGDPGAAAVAGIYAFGGRAFDAAAALAFMRKSGLEAGTACAGVPIRPGGDSYLALGYVPSGADGVWGPAATTLEYASADAAVAQFARSVGDDATRKAFLAQSANWRKLFDPASGLMRARDPAGAWIDGVSEATTDNYVEGTAAQYRWLVPHDFRGLIDALGGDQAAVAHLDTFFTKLNANMNEPYYYIGNEPGFSSPYVYLWAHAPWRTQDVVRRVVEESFGLGPAGLPGNDDLGATSSWLVWSSIGLFPAVPGVGGLALASPLFPRITLRVAGGKTVVITAPRAPARYVAGLRVDGAAYERPWLDESFLAAGGRLDFDLAERPGSWGQNLTPPSFPPN